jgi:concanavalin A-like lectin/glucanase superfamily protein
MLQNNPILPPTGFTFELNRESKQNRGLRVWYPANWSAKSNSIYNLAYARDGKGTLSSANSWSINVPNVNYALEFDGSTTCGINVGSNSTHRFTNEISVFGWVYFRAVPSTNNSNPIMSISDNITTSGWEFAHRNTLGGATSLLAFAYYDGGVQGWYTGSVNLSINTLYHVGFTYKPGTLNFYVNGALDNSPSITGGTIVYVSDSTRLGDQTQNLEFNGGIADLRLYNRYLNANDVSNLYKPQTRWELYKPINRFYSFKNPVTTQNVTVNLADSVAIGNNLTTNQIQVIGKSDAVAIGNDLITNQIQPINKSDALAIGYDISIASNVIIGVNAADSVVLGYNLTNNYIMSLTSANALANSTLLNTYYLQSIGQALATAIGNNLNSIYSQPVNSGLAVALGYSINTQVGAVNKLVGLADAIALGRNVTTTDFELVLSLERTYKPDFYNRTYIPSDDRIFKIKHYG